MRDEPETALHTLLSQYADDIICCTSHPTEIEKELRGVFHVKFFELLAQGKAEHQVYLGDDINRSGSFIVSNTQTSIGEFLRELWRADAPNARGSSYGME